MWLIDLGACIVIVIANVVTVLLDIGLILQRCDGCRFQYKSVDAWVTLLFLIATNIALVAVDVLAVTRLLPVVRAGLGI